MTDVQNYPFPQPEPLEPPAEWARLRGECPVSRVRMASGDEVLLLTRYADVRGMLADPRFTRNLTTPDAARIADSETGGVFNEETVSASMTSGEGHARWRRMMSRSFTAKRVNALRPRIEQLANDLIDDMVAGGAPADLAAALGFPLPVFVICELLGVPAGHREQFSHWSDAMLNLSRYQQAEIDKAAQEFGEFMVAHVLAKRADPGDDLISELAVIVDSEDGRLSGEELVATAQGLLVAGHETTANMIGKMMGMLLADPARWERLVADRTLVPTAVDESLRFDANFGFGLPRYLTEEVRVGDETIAAGSTVVTCLGAANRDDRVFADAAEMVLDRSPNPHLAFGAGPHACLGQSLARVELQTVLTVLLDRLPGLRLAVPPDGLRRKEGLIVGGLEGLPVRW
ncbi:cytochrome P450 [Paractinoplanes rishiriensis]|uniref:Cytochrome P450 n=1 Tax=Paractinoplanes rishiriensis TaxID=1050105 RepID=A0A919N150_9ACTN|nr:cytochrome P450 [Actinoplanes rishiriensis]GIF00536.1 cytochrome P450 [Actinoplanes rishiriensis]